MIIFNSKVLENGGLNFKYLNGISSIEFIQLLNYQQKHPQFHK